MDAAWNYEEVRPGRTTAATATNATTPTTVPYDLASEDRPASISKTDLFQGVMSPTAGRAGDKALAAEAAQASTRRLPSPGLISGQQRSSVAPGRLWSHLHVRRAESSPLYRFWQANRPSILVALSQLFGALMNLSARFLELQGDGMHPIQMLLLRQSVTSVCCVLYMWWMKTPGFPIGAPEIRWLLLLRGSVGFFGIFGMWWSMIYLPLADATVITFLAPGVAGFVCYFFLNEPFTRAEQAATLVAFLGVVLIAQPTAFFAGAPLDEAHQEYRQDRRHRSQNSLDADRPHSFLLGAEHEITPQERILAVGVGLLGVLGSAGAFVTVRAIGKRAHPLISVNAFAVICTIICVACLTLGPVLDIAQPSLRWVSPTSATQWFLLLSLGTFGFVMQYLLTAGLAADKSNRANAMVYTHMLFAVSFDWWIFDHQMGLMSFAGCALILCSAVSVVLVKKKSSPLPSLRRVDDVDEERQGNLSGDEGDSPMLVSAARH
ncbi:hypothetical protein E4U53_002235 [Claviceps sorghi]|nr:hypothetical protein E4U53_002235 [Claviceps sorghi]